MENKIIIVIIAITLILVSFYCLFLPNGRITAFEGLPAANELASNWKDDAMLSVIGGSKEFSKGKCSSWYYIYKSPMSMKLLYYNSTFSPTGQYCDAKYEEICIIVYASGKSEIKYYDWMTYYQRADPNNITLYISDLQKDILNLSVDSDEAYASALSDSEIKDFTSRFYGYSTTMQAQGDWEQECWDIWFEANYGIDEEHNHANIYINGTSGAIEYKDIGIEGNNFFYICTVCPIIVFIVICLIIVIVMIRRDKKRMQNQPPQKDDKQPK